MRSLSTQRRTGQRVSVPFGQLRIARGAEQLPESEWQSLVRGRPALRLEVLRAIESNATRPLPLQIFLLEDPSGLAAAAICEAVAAGAAHNPLDALLFGRAARAARCLGASTQPVLVFQSPLMRQSPILVRAADAAEQQRLLNQLLERIEGHAAEFKLGIAFVGVTPEDEPQWTALLSRRYLLSEIESTARLEIEWTDFDSYVQHLRQRSSNAAQTARKERNRNRRSAVDIRRVHRTESDLRALYLITRDHHRYKNGHDPLYGPQFLPQLSQALGDDLLVFEAVRDGVRLAMLAVVRSGTVGWVAWIGIEQRDRLNDFTYANIMFYHPADWAPALGLKSLLYGTAVQKAKAIRGCRLLVCHLFYRPHRSVLRLVARPFLAIHQAWYRRKNR
jgi:predicted N-acyltransferase